MLLINSISDIEAYKKYIIGGLVTNEESGCIEKYRQNLSRLVESQQDPEKFKLVISRLFNEKSIQQKEQEQERELIDSEAEDLEFDTYSRKRSNPENGFPQNRDNEKKYRSNLY